MDRTVYGVAETGTWRTSAPNPHVELSGASPSGVSIAQIFADAVANGESVTVTVRLDVNNWACYGHQSGLANSVGPVLITGTPDRLDFSNATLRDSKGILTDADPVEVVVETPEQSFDTSPRNRQFFSAATGTLAWDVEQGANGFRVDLNGDITIGVPTNTIAQTQAQFIGGLITLRNASGATRTIGWNAVWDGPDKPTSINDGQTLEMAFADTNEDGYVVGVPVDRS